MVYLRTPWVHCPRCHRVYRQNRLTHPLRCAYCAFNLLKWRREHDTGTEYHSIMEGQDAATAQPNP